MNLKATVLSEGRQAQETTVLHDSTCRMKKFELSRKGKAIETETTTVFAWPGMRRRQEGGLTANGHEGSSWGDEDVLKLIYGNCCTWPRNKSRLKWRRSEGRKAARRK